MINEFESSTALCAVYYKVMMTKSLYLLEFTLNQSPLYSGFLFSRNAANPSNRSSVGMIV